MVSFASRVEIPKHVMVRFLVDESVFLNLESERYFGLDPIGTRMWQLVTAAPSIDTAYHQLLGEYEVEPDTLRTHLSELVQRLADNGLLQVVPSDVGTAAAI